MPCEWPPPLTGRFADPDLQTHPFDQSQGHGRNITLDSACGVGAFAPGASTRLTPGKA